MAEFDLGSYSRKITTTSSDAKTAFDQGLIWLFGYNHEAAAECFEKSDFKRSQLRHGALGYRL